MLYKLLLRNSKEQRSVEKCICWNISRLLIFLLGNVIDNFFPSHSHLLILMSRSWICFSNCHWKNNWECVLWIRRCPISPEGPIWCSSCCSKAKEAFGNSHSSRRTSSHNKYMITLFVMTRCATTP